MSEVSAQANAIVLAASTRLISLCTKASQNLVDGIESKKQFKQAHRILILLKAYNHSADMNAYEADALLYCLKKLSDASSFPTTNPIVGQSLNVIFTTTATYPLPAGVMVEIGDWDASGDTFPAIGGTGSGGSIQKGNWWNIIGPGSPGGESVEIGASILAKIDNPGQTLANWRIMP